MKRFMRLCALSALLGMFSCATSDHVVFAVKNTSARTWYVSVVIYEEEKVKRSDGGTETVIKNVVEKTFVLESGSVQKIVVDRRTVGSRMEIKISE